MAEDLKLKLQIDSILDPTGLEQAKGKLAELETQAAATSTEVAAVGASTALETAALGGLAVAVSMALPLLKQWFDTTFDQTVQQERLKDEFKEILPLLERYARVSRDIADSAAAQLALKQSEDLEAQRLELEKIKRDYESLQNIANFDPLGTGVTEGFQKKIDALAGRLADLQTAQLQGITVEQLYKKRIDESNTANKNAAEEERKRAKAQKEYQAGQKRWLDYQAQQDLDAQLDMKKQTSVMQAELLKRLMLEGRYAEAYALFKRMESQADERAAAAKEQATIDSIGYIGASLTALSSAFGQNKALAIAGAIADTWAGAARALGKEGPPWPANIAAAAMVAAQGLAAVENIRKAEPVGFDDPFADLTARRLGRRSAVDFVRNFGGAFTPGVVAGMGALGATSNTTINRNVNMGGLHIQGALGPRPAFDKWLERAMTRAERARRRTTVGR